MVFFTHIQQIFDQCYAFGSCRYTAFDMRLYKTFRCRCNGLEVFLRKVDLKICSKFTGEHPCQSAISIMLLAFQWMFSCEFAAQFQNSRINLFEYHQELYCSPTEPMQHLISLKWTKMSTKILIQHQLNVGLTYSIKLLQLSSI